MEHSSNFCSPEPVFLPVVDLYSLRLAAPISASLAAFEVDFMTAVREAIPGAVRREARPSRPLLDSS